MSSSLYEINQHRLFFMTQSWLQLQRCWLENDRVEQNSRDLFKTELQDASDLKPPVIHLPSGSEYEAAVGGPRTVAPADQHTHTSCTACVAG